MVLPEFRRSTGWPDSLPQCKNCRKGCEPCDDLAEKSRTMVIEPEVRVEPGQELLRQ